MAVVFFCFVILFGDAGDSGFLYSQARFAFNSDLYPYSHIHGWSFFTIHSVGTTFFYAE